MNRQPLSEAVSRELASAAGRAVLALQDPLQVGLLQKFRADPIAVIGQFGAPVAALDAEARRELGDGLRSLAIPERAVPKQLQDVNWNCIVCEAMANAIIVAAGGVTAIALAMTGGMAVLAASGVVAAIVAWSGLTAEVVASILAGVAGGEGVVLLEAASAAICEAIGSCA